MIKQVRLQLSRQRGFDLQALSKATNGLAAVNCARPSRWGNPARIGAYFMVGDPFSSRALRMSWCSTTKEHATPAFTFIKDAAVAVAMFRKLAESGHYKSFEELRGKNLACHCAPSAACHCDVLLELANG